MLGRLYSPGPGPSLFLKLFISKSLLALPIITEGELFLLETIEYASGPGLCYYYLLLKDFMAIEYLGEFLLINETIELYSAGPGNTLIYVILLKLGLFPKATVLDEG